MHLIITITLFSNRYVLSVWFLIYFYFKLIPQCANSKYFYEKYHWLIVSNGIKIVETLEAVPFDINSDITVAVPITGNTLKWNIMDIYNPSLLHGGKLRLRTLGYFDNMGYHVNYSGGKYSNRRNMTGVTFTSAMVVRK